MNYQDIAQWLKKYGITNYTIHENLVVDVDCDVNLYNNKLTALPFQFGKVTGNFHCSNNQLTSLQYCPTAVGGGFYCYNNQLTSLQYCPTTVGGFVDCSDNPFIVTEENEESWLQAIKNHKEVYEYIKEPTEEITSLYKMLWEV